MLQPRDFTWDGLALHVRDQDNTILERKAWTVQDTWTVLTPAAGRAAREEVLPLLRPLLWIASAQDQFD